MDGEVKLEEKKQEEQKKVVGVVWENGIVTRL